MDKLYTIVNVEYTKDVGKTFVNLYIVPDESLILYFNNSPRYKLVRIHGERDGEPIECNYYGTVDQITCNNDFEEIVSQKHGSNSQNVISIHTSIPDIKYDNVSFPLADIKHELKCLLQSKPCVFNTSNNPAQGYYDSYLRKFVYPSKPSKLKPYSYIFENYNTDEEEQTCGKNGACSINIDEPALYSLDDITPIPYCSNNNFGSTPRGLLVENFTIEENYKDENDEGGCPCNKKNGMGAGGGGTPQLYSEGLIFFNKNKLCIYVGILILLIIVLCFLCFKKKRF